MRFAKILAGAVALVCLTVVPLSAQKGNSGSHGPSTKAQPTSKPQGPSATTHGPSTTSHGPSTTKKAPSTTTTSHGPTSKATTKPIKTETKLAKADVKSIKTTKTSTTGTADTTSGTTSTSTSGTTTTATKIDFTASPVGQKLLKNSALTSKLETRLGGLDYNGTVYQAAYGFKNVGQFVAATNISKNLGIPFEQLKLSMTGMSVDSKGTVLVANLTSDGTVKMVKPELATNPVPTKSLGQSIQTSKSGVDATAAAQTATTQAEAEIQSTSTTTTSTTTAKKPTKTSSN